MKTPKVDEQLNELKSIARDLQWMAKRYATGRSTYAVNLVNDHTLRLLNLGVSLQPGNEGTIWAEDGMGRDFDRLDEEQLTPGSPGAAGQYVPLPPGYHLARELEAIAKTPANLLRKWNLVKGALEAIAKDGNETAAITLGIVEKIG